MDVDVQRPLAGVRRTALQAGAATHAVRVGVGVDGLERRAERCEAGLDGPHALLPVGPLADPEGLLDALDVWQQVTLTEGLAAATQQAARRVPLRIVLGVGAQTDLRVDRRPAADAAPAKEGDGLTLVRRRNRLGDRPPEVAVRLCLPAHEVGCTAVLADLKQQHAATALCKLAGDQAAAGARTDHDDLEVLGYCATPMNDQSFLTRSASGKEKSISDQAPGPGAPGATKSL